jgi:hypothetical protein
MIEPAEESMFLGKRLDEKGYDIVVRRGETSWAAFGPYKTRLDAQVDLAAGGYRNDEPHTSEGWDGWQ